MMHKLRTLWSGHKLLLLAFVLAAGFMVLFAVRTVVFAIYWGDPAHSHQVVAPWMTPRYISESWRISPDQMADLLDLPHQPPRRRMTLADIAEDRGQDPAQLASDLQAALELLKPAGARE